MTTIENLYWVTATTEYLLKAHPRWYFQKPSVYVKTIGKLNFDLGSINVGLTKKLSLLQFSNGNSNLFQKIWQAF